MYNIQRPKWYAKARFIRRKRNHSWSGQEMKKVYGLRIQQIPVDLIIQKLHLKDVKRSQVYNLLRIMKKNRHGKCFQCGHDLTKKELMEQNGKTFKICSECQEKNTKYKRKIRKINYRKGLCTCCGKVPPLKGKKSCIRCLSYTHRNRIAEGKCGACGERPLSPKSSALCDVCLEINRINVQIHHRKELAHANHQ